MKPLHYLVEAICMSTVVVVAAAVVGIVVAYLYSITTDIEHSSALFTYRKHTHQEKPLSSIYSNY